MSRQTTCIRPPRAPSSPPACSGCKQRQPRCRRTTVLESCIRRPRSRCRPRGTRSTVSRRRTGLPNDIQCESRTPTARGKSTCQRCSRRRSSDQVHRSCRRCSRAPQATQTRRRVRTVQSGKAKAVERVVRASASRVTGEGTGELRRQYGRCRPGATAGSAQRIEIQPRRLA